MSRATSEQEVATLQHNLQPLPEGTTGVLIRPDRMEYTAEFYTKVQKELKSRVMLLQMGLEDPTALDTFVMHVLGSAIVVSHSISHGGN